LASLEHKVHSRRKMRNPQVYFEDGRPAIGGQAAQVFGSSANLSPNVSHTFSSASDITRITSGLNGWPAIS
jgi:hypothetical protein